MEPWLAKLDAGHHDDAWDLFVDTYRRLILATIRRVVHDDDDDVMDVFSYVCAALRVDDLARLRRYAAQPARARFSTWLVVVVRNLAVDWGRDRDGRHTSPRIPDLSPLQREIYAAVFLEHRTHVEAYEMIAQRAASDLAFSDFLREVRATYRSADAMARRTVHHPDGQDVVPMAGDLPSSKPDPARVAELTDASERLESALASLEPEVRLAIDLFVVDGVPAPRIARILGWSNDKAVYNRVYRALRALRVSLADAGIRHEDLT